MLDELISFKGDKLPSPYEKPPIYKWNMKLSKSKEKSLNSKYSKFNIESIDDIKEEEEMTLAEKVLQRQLEEKEKLEEKKRKILKELHKKKKRLNIKKFLTREAGYEQKKMYNLEQKRLKELEEENKNFKDKPLLSIKTIEICKNKKIKNKPIYLRTREIIENRQKNLENLNNKLKKEKLEGDKLNKSMDQINNNEYIVNNEIKDKKMTKKDMINYYKKQNEWKNKLNEKRSEKDTIKNEKEEKKYKAYFHPKLSRGTEEIIIAMNEAKENYLYQTTETSNNNYFITESTIPNPNYLNYDNDVFKRLYENKKLERTHKYSFVFQPQTNKNRYKKINPKYKDINKISRNTKNNKNKKIQKKKERSVEIKYYKNRNNKNKKEETVFKKEDNKYEPWTNFLLKLKKNKSSEISYRLNIRQSSAWNENDVNIVPLKGESKEIIKDFI